MERDRKGGENGGEGEEVMLGRRGSPALTRGRGARRGRTTVTRESSPTRKGRGAVIGCTQAQDR